MRRRSPILVLAIAVVAVAGACTAAANGAALWTYGPTRAPEATAGPTPSPAIEPTAAPSPTAATGAITLSEWKVAVAATFHAGTTTFTIANQGTTEHELLVFKSDLPPAAYPTDASGDIIEDGQGVTLLSDGDNIAVDGSQSRTVDLTPGRYLFVCNIPGHFKNGMFTVVTVTP